VPDKPLLDYRSPPPPAPTDPEALPVEIWVVFGLVLGAGVLVVALTVLGIA
jgi:hypothetical protein